jgi:polysaccharide pyruvyl transferase WcaK-like protein
MMTKNQTGHYSMDHKDKHKGLKAVLFRMGDASQNKGEEAILHFILDVLRPVCRQIVVIDSDPDLVRTRHGVASIANHWKKFPTILRNIARADIVVWAGGHMVQDISSQWSILGRLWQPMIAKSLRRRLLIYAVDIGPLHTRIGWALSRYFFTKKMNSKDLLIVRNPESRDLLRKLNVKPDRIMMTPDPALSNKFGDRESARSILQNEGIDVGKPVIGLIPRDTFHMTSGMLPVSIRRRFLKGRDQTKERSRAFQISLARTIDRIVSEMDAQVVLVPMDTGPNPRDDLLCTNILRRVEHPESVHILGDKLDLSATYGMLAEMDLVISGRFHGCVFSAVNGTPIVPMNTGQHKVPRLMRMLGYDRQLLSINDIADDTSGWVLFGEVREIWGRRGTERKRLKEHIETYQEQWKKTAQKVSVALGK